MILASNGSLTFHHDLVREAASSTVPSAAAIGLHRALARYYLSGGDPLIAAGHARAAASPGDLTAANILIATAELLVPVSADDAGELATLAFQTDPSRPGRMAQAEPALSLGVVAGPSARPRLWP